MAKITRAACLLLLLSLLGCHPDEPEAVQRAQQERIHQKQMTTDQASLLFAEQELALANAKAAAAQAAGAPQNSDPEQSATFHIQQAKLRLALDRDQQQLDRDFDEWKALGTMLRARQSHEGHS